MGASINEKWKRVSLQEEVGKGKCQDRVFEAGTARDTGDLPQHETADTFKALARKSEESLQV